ncbi:MAG: hypothetical protein ABJA78_07190 [Ferruginibacter sp.]
MNDKKYLETFQRATSKLDQKRLQKKQIEVAAGIVLDCPFLKLYKRSWASPSKDPLTATSRIFFSVWLSNAGAEEQKIFYNIHAFKLRQLKGYSIQSRKFADAFRKHFKQEKQQWPNVSVQYGPLTLMEGWLKVDLEDFLDETLELANNFLKIEYLIDETLAEFKQ